MIPRGSSPSVNLGTQAAGFRSSADPLGSYNFAIQIEGLVVAGCSSIDGIEARVETETFSEGGVNGYVHQFPRQTTFSNLVLTRGMSGERFLWQWFDSVSRGAVVRRNGTIMLLDDQQRPSMWWNFRGAYPVRWSGPPLNAIDGGLAFESVELVHEGISQPVLSQAAHTAKGVL